MKLTEFFRLRMPDGTDPVNIEDFNDNFEVIDKELKKRISSGESASDVTVEFETAESRQPLKSGEKLSVLMGKAHRFFTDLKTVAFSGKYGDLSERPTLGGAAGYKVADNDTTNSSEFLSTARVAYEHGLEIDALSRDFISFQTSFRDGCSTIAAAITEMGVSTASNASPTVMASNIKKIKPLPLEAVAMLGIFGGGNINNSCIVPVDFAGIKSFTYTVYSDGNDNKRYDMYVRSGGLTGGAITNHYGVNGRSQSYTDTVDCTQFHGISGLYFYFSRKLEITNIVRL